MPLYEVVFIARQDLTPGQVETLTEDVTKLIKDQKGTVAKTEQWGLRSLFYRIRKNKKGHYVLLNVECPPAAIQEMERTMRLSDDYLRYMSIRVDTHEEGPSAPLRKSPDDERPAGQGFGYGGGGRGGDRGGALRRTARPLREGTQGEAA